LFDGRIDGSDANSGIHNTIFFDTHTDGTFTTAVPEPATWAMMLAGFGGLGAAMRRRRVAFG
jgi:PEP-CTERM motif